jgi:alkylated DNA repair dioxygenase AlkB
MLPGWLAPAEADAVFTELLAELALRQEPIRMFGRDLLQPRLTLWMGDHPYRYSGKTFAATPWTPAAARLRDQVGLVVGTLFNSVLCNMYRNGQDSMGAHADDEPELGQNPVIASLSFGATRRLVFRARKRDALAPIARKEFALTHGSLLVMDGETQLHWLHAIPKAQAVRQPRLNLTFRTILA